MIVPMNWTDWVTLGIAVFGAALGLFNTVLIYRRGSVRWCVLAEVKRGEDGLLDLYVELVNTGRIAVEVEEVTLTFQVEKQSRSERLRNAAGHPTFPRKLSEGKKVTIGPVHRRTLQEVSVFEPLTIMAKSEDGRIVQTRCTDLRKLYTELKSAAAK